MLAAALIIAVGVPLFLRMPVWCDITLYDTAAATILGGGTHYRDLFDTNTPGYVWLLVGIRSLVGWSSEALRVVDLAFVGGVLFVLDRLARRGGATPVNRLWMAAGGLGFYLFTPEQVHCQRDVWLALPALLAVAGRLKRITEFRPRVYGPAVVEGLLWGCAVWIKPHFLLVAVAVWLLTIRRLAGVHPRPWPAVGRDLLGSLTGGGAIGLLGIVYLFASGTWPHFVEVMTFWNVGYMETTLATLPDRLDSGLIWFPPWSFLLPPTVMLATLGLIDARIWSGRFRHPEQGGVLHQWAYSRYLFRGGSDRERYTRAVVGGVYIVWVSQSLILQRPYHYAHAIEVLLSLLVWATYRWNVSAVVAVWLGLVGAGWAVAPLTLRTWSDTNPTAGFVLTPHPITNPDRLKLWPACVRPTELEAEYWRRQDALRYETFHAAAIGWSELHEVAEFLRPHDVRDRELVCWHDSPHPLYLRLVVRPGIRFMHVNTACLIGREARERVRQELWGNPAVRFVVIDLRWYALLATLYDGNPGLYEEQGIGGQLLPPRMPPEELQDLPFLTSLPVFRSSGGRGRYVVFAVK